MLLSSVHAIQNKGDLLFAIGLFAFFYFPLRYSAVLNPNPTHLFPFPFDRKMVHRMDAVKFSHGANNKRSRRKFKVKSELAGEFDSEESSLSKRPKLDFSIQGDDSKEPMSPVDYYPLVESSPLGLKLKKTPSFLDLIQMRLGKERSASLGKTLPKREKDKESHKKSSSSVDKLKASNFPATLLKIGTWEYKSRYEGDLVAKCYFAKHKLVWEVLDGGLKNKIEVQWSDIVAIKANCLPDGPETLDVVLGRQPLFFREINPQPRKHTLWQATSDFTGGQATLYRRHFLRCSEGLLGKHFEKLIQCDPRLNFLCQQPDVVLDNPYFESKNSVFGGPSESDNAVDLKTEIGNNVFNPRDTATISGASSLILNSQGTPPSAAVADVSIRERLSGERLEDISNLKILDQIKLPGLHPSMSMSDLVSHIGQCITEQIDPSLPINEEQKNSILQDIAQYLMSDSQAALPVYEEKSIMSRVNSLCSLLQKDQIPVVQTPFQVKSEDAYNIILPPPSTSSVEASKYFSPPSGNSNMENDSNKSKTSDDEPNMIRCPAMSRKDSMGDLLLNLPRIASLPQFLFNFPDDSGK